MHPTAADTLTIEPVGLDALDEIRAINRACFDEERVINSFDRQGLRMLMAYADGEPVGFKIGYRENRFNFYSAKGGVLLDWRRSGIARLLLKRMEDVARLDGYRYFCYDTFPNVHPGMTVLGLASGYRVTRADFNATYRDFRLRFEKRL
jgi:GNAT superfamily N-acetyltransferase